MDFNNSDFVKAARDAMAKAFGLKTEVDMENKIAKAGEQTEEPKSETIDVKNTWVWVEGYKGTDKDMCCQGFQYELGTKYQMPRENVDECRTGYHFCLNMNDVQKYYGIGHGNRYFKVRALVRLSDKNEYGRMPEYDPNDMYRVLFGRTPRDKLVAAEIEFLEELSIDEILSDTKAKDWSEEYKKLVIELGIDAAETKMRITELAELGYSLPFASYLIEHKKYNVAKAVGSQPNLSMDMKVLMIMQG